MFEIDFYTQNDDTLRKVAQENLLSSLEDWERHIWQFISNWYDPSIETISVFTSGSTGAPKQISHTKVSMLFSAGQTCRALNLKPGDTALLCLPVNKISGMMMVVRSIFNKMKLICIRPSSSPLQVHSDGQLINFAAFTPMQFNGITSNHSSYVKADAIEKIILGGEDVKAELLHDIRKLKSQVYITYGMTETISHIALKRLNGPVPDTGFSLLPGIKIATDVRGCLIIEAPNLGQPHLVTNDVVKLLGENTFQWLGRIDNVINSGGVKIYPEEIERQLLNRIDIPFFITGLPDERTGEKLVLVLESTTLEHVQINSLNAAFMSVEKLHRPKEALLVPRFERTDNGKIKRKETLVLPTQLVPLISK